MECDLRRREAIVTLTEFYKENPQYKNNSCIIDSEDSEDSSGGSGAPEPDGWEPEANKKEGKETLRLFQQIVAN